MSINDYSRFFSGEFLMGPNSLRILDSLLTEHPLCCSSEDVILDLGCGTGLTSYYLCRECGASVIANDLWVSEADNAARFEALGAGNLITPLQKDARELKLESERYSAVVSIDSYHYFAGSEGFFSDFILPCVKPGGTVLIGIPGIKDEFDSRTHELLSPWLGEEAGLFRSPRQWRELIGTHPDIESIRVWESDCFEQAWGDWLATDNPYAAGDRTHYEGIIKPFTCFVSIAVRKK